ncbi:MAG: nickel pincer cofactor biosynthesis protein LarB [Pirellulales bacterium]|nr:nickel pincer cofactor biosynthesis protein LarB [Pirellulales bacterium]
MNKKHLQHLAQELLNGQLSVDAFTDRIASSGIADVGHAQVDLDRNRRCGFPEVIFAEGKSIEALLSIVGTMRKHDIDVLATRISAEQAKVLKDRFPIGNYNSVARTFRLPPETESKDADESKCSEQMKRPKGRVTIVTAGTSDLPVAEEARETALWTGAEVEFIQDIGVAGPHRLTANLPLLQTADAVVVVAGMEGALPSVVGGHVACPVVAVPTSVGYGASFDGIAALLGMLNSCASNVTVVNIDAGFKGGYVAGLIAKNVARARKA